MVESGAPIRASGRTRAALFFLWMIAWVAWSYPAFSDPVPIWSVFDAENSDLPNNSVPALAPGSDGALWVGTIDGGLARLVREGHWLSYTKANTNGGLPSDSVRALAPGSDGALWVGTTGGLAGHDREGQRQ